jgi:NADH:ubiquinone oxidoreductase subunit F (NADH-binding)
MTALMPGPVTGEVEMRLPRLLLATGEDGNLAEHEHRHGAIPYRGGRGLLVDTLDAAGLTGRGGAGFPTARKWRAVAGARGSTEVVGNAAEGEPASSKDRVLLDSNPHLVLDGLQLAAEAVGARQATLYLHPHPALRNSVLAALQVRRDDRVPVRVVVAAHRFLAGEESAVVDALEGGIGLPRSTPPRVFERGLNGRPTLVQNAETLAQVALAARYGAAWFRQVGTDAEPGSMLATVRVPGDTYVAEVAQGIALSALMSLDDTVQALLIGGYHGAWVPVADARELALSRASLERVKATPGAGVLVSLPASACGVVESARVMTYLAAQSAGQCGPCLNGLPRIALALEDLAAGRARAQTVADLHRWAGLVERRGACHHPDGSVRFLRSALTTFAREVGHHLRGRCSGLGAPPVLPVPVGRGSS